MRFMKKSIYIILTLTIFLTGTMEVDASSGQLRKASIKTCNGVTYGQHSSDNHWHVASVKDGKYYATGSPIYNDPCRSNNNSSHNSSSGSSSNNNASSSTNNNSSNNSINNNTTTNNNSSSNEEVIIKPEEPKSNDNTLKAILIDGKTIEIEENMSYLTKEEKVDIKVETNDTKATYEIKNNSYLSVGNNEVIIEVKAEDGSIKNYKINIERTAKSSDTGIKVKIDEEEVIFSNYKATINVESSTKSIIFDYTLNDENARAEVDELSEIKTGDNIINIKVIAEDGTEQIYEINIYKYSKTEDAIYTALAFGIIGGTGYGIYRIWKKVKRKK